MLKPEIFEQKQAQKYTKRAQMYYKRAKSVNVYSRPIPPVAGSPSGPVVNRAELVQR
jgi:hypothetical protein